MEAGMNGRSRANPMAQPRSLAIPTSFGTDDGLTSYSAPLEIGNARAKMKPAMHPFRATVTPTIQAFVGKRPESA